MPSALSASAPLLAVALAGQRLVAVGVRGHIVSSADGGKHWQQVPVPVSVDLVAVSFPSAKDGWAVGHGGVVLHSADGGATWSKQLSGRASSDLAIRHYQAAVAQARNEAEKAEMAQALRREESLAKDSGTPSFLDVHFANDKVGYVVGTFNRIFRTEDGGQTWVPWMDRTGNPKSFNFYAVQERGGHWYLAGEQGLVWQLDTLGQRFAAIPTPYKGTLFGLTIDSAHQILVYGMRGSLFRSADQGRNWVKVDAGTTAGITGATELSDGRIVLANQAGGYSISADHGGSFVAQNVAATMSNFGLVAIAGNKLVLVGSQGVRVEPLH